MAAFGFQPIQGYSSMLDAALLVRKEESVETLRRNAVDFYSIRFSVANSAGFFNIGLSGQSALRIIVSVWVALAFPHLPKVVLLPLCAILGALAGAMAAAVPWVATSIFEQVKLHRNDHDELYLIIRKHICFT